MADTVSKYAKIKNEIQKKIDIVSLIERHVPLKQSGNGYIGLCPFHKEKTPSFSVTPNTENGGFYHCFGCQKSGDAFTFIMEKEGYDFIGAMKALAGEYGILWDVEDKDNDEKEDGAHQSSRTILLKSTEFATKFFYNEMTKNDEAVNFLKNRNINPETAKEFRLGFAPNSVTKLLQAAKANGFSENVLLETALIKKNENGVFDFFRNRIIFPIFDYSGRPIAFGGRAFGDAKPKYLNSSNTPLYDKSKIFYGYYQAQKEIKAQKTVIIVEGYMDMLALYQNGIKNVLAPCGTSFSEEHAKFLSRIAEKAVIVFDGDDAGINGAKKIVEKLMQFEVDTRHVLIPQNQDPDDFIKSENGKEKFLQLIENAQSGFEFLIDRTEKQHGVFDTFGKSRIIKEIAETLSAVQNKIMLSDYITVLSNRYKIPPKEIRSFIENFRRKKNEKEIPQKTDSDSENRSLLYTEEGMALRLFFHFPQILQEYMYGIPYGFFAEPMLNKLYYLLRNGELDRGNIFINNELSRQEKAFIAVLLKEKLGETSEKEARRQIAAKINKFRIIEKQKENKFLKQNIMKEKDEEAKGLMNKRIIENNKKIANLQVSLQTKKRGNDDE